MNKNNKIFKRLANYTNDDKIKMLENFKGIFIEDYIYMGSTSPLNNIEIPKGSKIINVTFNYIDHLAIDTGDIFNCTLDILVQDGTLTKKYRLDFDLDINVDTNELLDWESKEVIAK